MFITEKLLLLSDPSLMEGGDQDGRTGLPGASCRPYLPLCGPRGCSCQAPRPQGFSRGPLCRGPLCRGCCVLFQGGSPTQGPPLQGLLCPLPGGLPDPGAEPSSPTAPALRGNSTPSHRGAHGRLLCGSKSRQTSKINLKTKHSQSW